MSVLVAKEDFTERWSCRESDLVLWLRAPGLFQNVASFQVVDFWYLRDGKHAILSNEPVDFPEWFTLHPTEVAGIEAIRMMSLLEGGFDPGDVVDGPNFWRVCRGDRIAWVRSRGVASSQTLDLLKIVDCCKGLLVAGEGRHKNPEEWMAFSDRLIEQPTAEQKTLVRSGVAAAIALGVPGNHSDQRLIG